MTASPLVTTAQMREIAESPDAHWVVWSTALHHAADQIDAAPGGADLGVGDGHVTPYIDVHVAALNVLQAKLDAKDKRIAELEAAMQQAADLIAIPAGHHLMQEMAKVAPVTGLPRYSHGAQIHNKACADLLPVLQAALAQRGGM